MEETIQAEPQERQEEFLGKTKEQTKEEFREYVLAKFRAKLIYPLLDGGYSPEQIRLSCEKVAKLGINGVLMLAGYLPIAKKHLSGIENVGVAVSFPFGEQADPIKEIKAVAKEPVTSVVCCLSVSDLKYNKLKRAEKALKTLESIKKRKSLKVGVMIDVVKFDFTLLSAVAKKISNYKIDELYLSSAIYGDAFSREAFDVVKTAVNGKLKIIASNAFSSNTELTEAASCADGVVSSRTLDVLTEVENKVQNL